MADIIEFKNKKSKIKRPVDFRTLNKDRVPSVKRSPAEIETANSKVVTKLSNELNQALEAIAKTDKSSNVYFVKIHGEFALRIHRYNLHKRIYQEYAKRGIYFHFKLQRIDHWNTHGLIILFWDSDYSKLRNRIKRRIYLMFDRMLYIFSNNRG